MLQNGMFRQQDTHPSMNYQLLRLLHQPSLPQSTMVRISPQLNLPNQLKFLKKIVICGAGETRIKRRKEHCILSWTDWGPVAMFAHKYKNSEKVIEIPFNFPGHLQSEALGTISKWSLCVTSKGGKCRSSTLRIRSTHVRLAVHRVVKWIPRACLKNKSSMSNFTSVNREIINNLPSPTVAKPCEIFSVETNRNAAACEHGLVFFKVLIFCS